MGHPLLHVHPSECVNTTRTCAPREHNRKLSPDWGEGRLGCGHGLEEALKDVLKVKQGGQGDEPEPGQCGENLVERGWVLGHTVAAGRVGRNR